MCHFHSIGVTGFLKRFLKPIGELFLCGLDQGAEFLSVHFGSGPVGLLVVLHLALDSVEPGPQLGEGADVHAVHLDHGAERGEAAEVGQRDVVRAGDVAALLHHLVGKAEHLLELGPGRIGNRDAAQGKRILREYLTLTAALAILIFT